MTDKNLQKQNGEGNDPHELVERDFRVGTIAELCRPVAVNEISAQRLDFQEAFSPSDQGRKARIGRFLQLRSTQGRKRSGGGGKKMAMVKLEGAKI